MMALQRYTLIALLALTLLCIAGCERQVVRSKGYGGFQIDRGNATPAPTAFTSTPAQPTIKKRNKFDPLGSIGSFFAGMGNAFSGDKSTQDEEPPPSERVLSGEASPDSAYRPAWRSTQPGMTPGDAPTAEPDAPPTTAP